LAIADSTRARWVTTLGECEGKVIKAHTVSRGPNLSKIARAGHVVRYNADPAAMKKNGGHLAPQEVGIGDASVFLGFCAGHDRTLFSCIENEPFEGRADQCLAVAYRTLSREYYGKDASTHLRDTLRDADKGWPLKEQANLQHLLDLMDKGIGLSQKDLGHTNIKLKAFYETLGIEFLGTVDLTTGITKGLGARWRTPPQLPFAPLPAFDFHTERIGVAFRAARALLNRKQSEIAHASQVHVRKIALLESGGTDQPSALRLRSFYERQPIAFLGWGDVTSGLFYGVGVRWQEGS
jgi:hypothetical protein